MQDRLTAHSEMSLYGHVLLYLSPEMKEVLIGGLAGCCLRASLDRNKTFLESGPRVRPTADCVPYVLSLHLCTQD